jgi:hypothetical protein
MGGHSSSGAMILLVDTDGKRLSPCEGYHFGGKIWNTQGTIFAWSEQ